MPAWQCRLEVACKQVNCRLCVDVCLALQNSKQFQTNVSLAFTNPLYAILLVLCPWLKRAKQNKATMRTLADVSVVWSCVASCYTVAAGSWADVNACAVRSELFVQDAMMSAMQ